MQTFETERLILKPMDTEDAAMFLEMVNSPKWLLYIGDRNLHSLESAEQYINERVMAQYEKNGFGNFTLIRKADGIKMGTCGFYDREDIDGIEIGYALLPQFEGNGYILEAGRKVFEIAHHQLHIAKLKAITVKENIPSQKILTRLGMMHIGTVQLGDEELMLFEGETNNEAVR